MKRFAAATDQIFSVDGVPPPMWQYGLFATEMPTAALDPEGHPAAEEANPGFKAKGHDTRALQAYLGHKSIQHTVRYIELAPARFKDF